VRRGQPPARWYLFALMRVQIHTELGRSGDRQVHQQVSSVAARTKLTTALEFVREGDVLVVTKPDRLARSTRNLLDIVEDLEKRGIALVVLSFRGEQTGEDELIKRYLAYLTGGRSQLSVVTDPPEPPYCSLRRSPGRLVLCGAGRQEASRVVLLRRLSSAFHFSRTLLRQQPNAGTMVALGRCRTVWNVGSLPRVPNQAYVKKQPAKRGRITWLFHRRERMVSACAD
jgi:hypothetical protein